METSLLSKIQGSWLLVSMTYGDENGNVSDFYGKDPMGILTYDGNGYMNAQMGYSNRANFRTQSLGDGSPGEIIVAYKSYMAYYGRYYEREPGVIVHQVEGSLFPNWQGMEIIRYAEVEDDLLVISAPSIKFGNGTIILKAVWRRP